MDISIAKEIKSILKTKKISGSFQIKNLRKILQQLKEVDNRAEQKKGRYIVMIFILVIVLFISLITVNIWFIAPAATIFTIVILLTFLANKQDIPDETKNFTIPLLDLLKDDIEKKKAIKIEASLIKIDSKKNLQSKGEPYKSGVYHKCIDSLYEQEFLKLNLPFTDGNSLLIDGHYNLKKTEKTKKTARGKIKTKDKYKKKIIFLFKLTINPLKYKLKDEFKDQLFSDGIKNSKFKINAKQKGEKIILSMAFRDVTGEKVKFGNNGPNGNMTVVKSMADRVKDVYPDTKSVIKELFSLYGYIEPIKQNI